MAVDKADTERFRSHRSGQGATSTGAQGPGPQKDSDGVKKPDAATPKGSTQRAYAGQSGSESEVDADAQAIAGMSMRDRLCQIFTEIHQSMTRLADQYDAERKRVVYITPTLFT